MKEIKSVLHFLTGIICIWLTLQPTNSYAYVQHIPRWTKVEQRFLAKSMRQSSYPHEYFAVIEVRNHYDLGKLTALRFIEWVQNHPRGVVGFATGTTPEYFIKFLDFYKNNWHKPEVQAELQSFGINFKNFPKTSDLKLVQLEEIYPLSAKNYKKLSNYMIRHYAKLLEIKPANLLLMDVEKTGILAEKGMNIVFMNGKVDLSLLARNPNSQLESWQQRALQEVKIFCNAYENQIRAWGGLDFFVGNIGYGGQLGFNELGGTADSKTHFVPLDYETAAHNAKDFGGIDYARGKIAITVGLGTITFKQDAIMIITAAGEAKAAVVRKVVTNKPNIQMPPTLLQKFPNSRLYITDGAAKLLDDRQTEDLRFKSKHGWQQKHVDEIILHVALAEKKSILALTEADLQKHSRGRLLLENPSVPLHTMLQETRQILIKKIENGSKLSFHKGAKILHTGPHHEDIMLGYYPLFENLLSRYKNYYAYFTSGFSSVSDGYILGVVNRASDWWLDKENDVIFKKSRDQLLTKFKDAHRKQDIEQMNMLETTLAMKNLVEIYNLKNIDELKHTIRWLKDEYFPSKKPGDLDIAQIKMLKGMMRESEAERVWSLQNIPLQNTYHLRSKFYSGREFMRTPRYETDVVPFITLFNNIKPDIITVNDEPDSAHSGTNYKVLQIIAQGLRSDDTLQNPNLQIITHRNVWFPYSVHEANTFVPINNQSLNAQKKAYASCFNTQKTTAFPSPFFAGDAAAQIDRIQRDRLADLKILLGEDYFKKNSNQAIRDAAGFISLNQLSRADFFRRGENLQPAIDLEEAYITSKK